MRLNRYLALSGVASRRGAEKLIAEGLVQVNGKTVTELATFVEPGVDRVQVDGRRLNPPRTFTYLLLNKPEGHVTTARDPQGRRSTGLRRAFIAWNVYGLIDLLSAISLGMLYSPSTFGALRTDISTGLMTSFPMNLIPTFFLPLFILLHMLGLVRSRELTRAPR